MLGEGIVGSIGTIRLPYVAVVLCQQACWIHAMICTQSRLILMIRPKGELRRVCCVSAVICATACSAYRLLIPIPPCSSGPYTTALEVFRLYPILGKNVMIALFSIFTRVFLSCTL